jgi:hypothetical protein
MKSSSNGIEGGCLVDCGVTIALMLEDASTSETSIIFYQITWCNNPEDISLHTCCHVYLKLDLVKEL